MGFLSWDSWTKEAELWQCRNSAWPRRAGRQEALKAATKVESKRAKAEQGAEGSKRQSWSRDPPHLPAGTTLGNMSAQTFGTCIFACRSLECAWVLLWDYVAPFPLINYIQALEHEYNVTDYANCFGRMGWSQMRLKAETRSRKCFPNPGVRQGGPGRVRYLCLFSKGYTSGGQCFCTTTKFISQREFTFHIILRIST